MKPLWKMRWSDVLWDLTLYALALLMVFPFFWLLTTSLKPPRFILSVPPTIIPTVVTWNNYVEVFRKANVALLYFNTLRFALVSTFCIVLTSSIAGYVFAKYRFPLKNVIFVIMISTMMVPFQSYMIPLFLMMVKLHVVDNYLGLQLPYLVQAMGTFFMRQNFEAFPDVYLEAARIEGASEFAIMRRIALPNLQSAMGGISIFVFASTWDNLIWPLIITSTAKNYVWQLGLAMFKQQYTVDYGQFTAAAMVVVAPVILFFIVFRTRIMSGITLTGIK
ncbi:MAG: carbohydrate ABC transporter permease [Spirochaetes bacterium]|nr:carbohydrate ABC transporter permease [Spirochaetota bacterium]